MKKLTKILSILIAIILLAVAGGIFYIFNQSQPVSKDTEAAKVRVEIPSGISVRKVGNVLKENELIKNEDLFYYFARFPQLRQIIFPKEDNSVRFTLKSGIYYISPAMTIPAIQNLLSSGQQEFVKISIPEGLTISKIAAILEQNRICSTEDFKSSCSNKDILDAFSITGETAEGFLFPETYFMNLNMNSDDVVKLMIQTFFEKTASIPNFSDKTPEEKYEIVKLASIVEREYRVEDEAPLIASVFKNRLRRDIGLYSCATVEYIITEILGRPHPEKILISDTQIDNPYNTYKWAGLPPGPISNPGLVALSASTNTPKTNYYFFQVVNPEEGRHVFTTTFEEHKENRPIYTKKAAGK